MNVSVGGAESTSATQSAQPAQVIEDSLGAKKLGLGLGGVLDLNTQKRPVYTLPYYGADVETIESLTDLEVRRALRVYGGLVRRYDEASSLRMRLIRATRADYRPKQLTMEGVVISNRMNKSVVIAARRRAYASKIRLQYWRTRRFMAHDELDLCREGDRVVIRSCRPMSKRKYFVVVQNYGDPTYIGKDIRAEIVRKAAEEGVGVDPEGEGEGEGEVEGTAASAVTADDIGNSASETGAEAAGASASTSGDEEKR